MNIQEIKVINAQTISVNAKLQDKIATPSLEKQDVLPDESYDGLSKVVVDAVSLESKSVVPSKEVQILNPSENFVGFSQITVESIPNEYIIPSGNLDIRANGDYDVTKNASVNVKVEPKLQDKEARVTAPVNAFIHPDEGYDGLGYVNVIATVDTETKEVTPTKEVQTINPSDGKYIDSVTVNAIPDEYIVPSGELEITENGSYDVTDKASVKVATITTETSKLPILEKAFYGVQESSQNISFTRSHLTANNYKVTDYILLLVAFVRSDFTFSNNLELVAETDWSTNGASKQKIVVFKMTPESANNYSIECNSAGRIEYCVLRAIWATNVEIILNKSSNVYETELLLNSDKNTNLFVVSVVMGNRLTYEPSNLDWAWAGTRLGCYATFSPKDDISIPIYYNNEGTPYSILGLKIK